MTRNMRISIAYVFFGLDAGGALIVLVINNAVILQGDIYENGNANVLTKRVCCKMGKVTL